jgi:hypothetical protein
LRKIYRTDDGVDVGLVCVIVGVMKRFFLFSFIFTAACSSSSGNGNVGGSDAASDVTTPNDSSTEDATNDVASNDVSTNDVETTNDSGTTKDAGGSDSGTGSGDSGTGPSDASADGSDGAVAQVTLTINDYINWCNVTVNGAGPSTGNPQTYHFAPGTVVTVQGDTANAAAFYWGYWGNVAADGGLADGGEDLGKTVTFTITRDMTLNACCPDNGQPLTQCMF